MLDAAVADALGVLGGGPAVSASELGRQPAAVRRLVLRHLAEQAGGELGVGDTERILALGGRGSKSLDLAAACAWWSSTARCGSRVRASRRRPIRWS